jgi:hypothetical protein
MNNNIFDYIIVGGGRLGAAGEGPQRHWGSTRQKGCVPSHE